MAEYEMVLILNGASKEDLTKTEESIQKIFEKREIEINTHDNWGKQKLFHPIDKLEEGVYYFFRFKGNRSSIQPLTSDLRVLSGILKTFIKRLA